MMRVGIVVVPDVMAVVVAAGVVVVVDYSFLGYEIVDGVMFL